MSIAYKRSGDILCILNILKKYSDSNNILPISKIKALIEKEYGYTIEDRTIRRDINLLIEKFNYDISTYNMNKKGYFFNKDTELEFEKGESRIILDIFNYSPVVSEWISKKIISKIKNMQNEFDNHELDNYIVFSKDNKTQNNEIIINIEDICIAIDNKQKVSFEYYKYGLDKKLYSIGKYYVSPYALVYEEQSFYLVGIKEGECDFYTYRIDRIKNLECLTEEVVINKTKDDIQEFVTSLLYAFGGKKEKVKLLCHNRLIDPVIEKFGRDIEIKKYDDEHFILETTKSINGVKWWLKFNMEDCVVLEPQQLKEEMEDILLKSTEKYKNLS